MSGKQAVVNTTAGPFVIDLRPDLAPNHVGYFMKLAREGRSTARCFIASSVTAIIQGGDPLSKDPGEGQTLWDRRSRRPESGAQRGAGHARRRRGRSSTRAKPDSAGAQFFICVTDQPALDGKYTIFGRVSEGMDVVQKISESPANAEGAPNQRIAISSVAIRDTPPPEPEPFSSETPAELAQYRAVLETSQRPGHDRVLSRQGPGARPQLPAARAVGSFRRHGVSSGRPWLRRADRGTQHARAADRQAAEARAEARTPSSTIRSTSRASSRWLAATIRRAR